MLRNTVLFSLGSFSANLIGGLPSSLFPLIVLNKLGPTYSAYYYIDMMIISFLYMIPISISQSLFAESSSQESSIKKFIFKSFRLNSLVLIPAIIVTMVLGEYVLLVFGEDYARGGLNFLRIMALSTLFIPVNYTFGVFLRIRNKIKLINFTITIGTITTISVAYLFVPLFGLYGMAAALISGQLVQAIFYSIYIFVIRRFS